MWIYIFLMFSCLASNINAKSLKPIESNEEPSNRIKFPEDDSNTQPINPNQAIIAIQIINSTSPNNSKSNSKRTIETSLGYGGYQGNNFYYKTQDGKFEVYPYSQRDIPPKNLGKSSAYPNVDIQQAYSFIVGKKQQKFQNNYYIKQQQHQQLENIQVPQQSVNTVHSTYPTTLFSTLNQGQISNLSPHIPAQFIQYPVAQQNNHGQQTQLQIPVIVLRIYSDQLSHSNEIYPNLPASNPYASYVNMINLQTLLNGYVTNNVYSAGEYQPTKQYLPAQQHVLTSQHLPVQQRESTNQYLPAQQHESINHYLPVKQQHESTNQYIPTQQQYDLPISENYPKSTHTQVLIKPKKQYYKASKHSSHSGVSVSTPTGFSYKALPQQTENVYQTEVNPAQQYIAQGNEYSVPVVGAQNYYQNSQLQSYENTVHQQPYANVEQQQYENPQPEYEYVQQNSEYQETQHSGANPTASQQPAMKTNQEDSQTQYIYINEHELSNHGYVYKNPSTGEYMYYPSTPSQQSQHSIDTKYSAPNPTEHHSTTSAAYSYTTPSSKVIIQEHSSDVRPVTEKPMHKHYNFHAQNPRHAKHSTAH